MEKLQKKQYSKLKSFEEFRTIRYSTGETNKNFFSKIYFTSEKLSIETLINYIRPLVRKKNELERRSISIFLVHFDVFGASEIRCKIRRKAFFTGS